MTKQTLTYEVVSEYWDVRREDNHDGKQIQVDSKKGYHRRINSDQVQEKGCANSCDIPCPVLGLAGRHTHAITAKRNKKISRFPVLGLAGCHVGRMKSRP